MAWAYVDIGMVNFVLLPMLPKEALCKTELFDSSGKCRQCL